MYSTNYSSAAFKVHAYVQKRSADIYSINMPTTTATTQLKNVCGDLERLLTLPPL